MNFATVGPFYAVQIAPQYTGTIGGVVTDTSAQVLRADGTVIGGLYAAGEAPTARCTIWSTCPVRLS